MVLLHRSRWLLRSGRLLLPLRTAHLLPQHYQTQEVKQLQDHRHDLSPLILTLVYPTVFLHSSADVLHPIYPGQPLMEHLQ